jgi:hypothetical protein
MAYKIGNRQYELMGNRQLLNEVMGLFKMKGTTLNQWCNANGIAMSNARIYLLGKSNGPKAREWRQRIVEAAEKMEVCYEE